MSQEKVDRYKKEKANREKIMRRERWITRLEVTAFIVVVSFVRFAFFSATEFW